MVHNSLFLAEHFYHNVWCDEFASRALVVFAGMVFCPIVGIVEFVGSPIDAELFLAFAVAEKWNRMSMALVRLGTILPLTTLSAIELSVWSGVAGCGWPISSRIIRM